MLDFMCGHCGARKPTSLRGQGDVDFYHPFIVKCVCVVWLVWSSEHNAVQTLVVLDSGAGWN